VVTYGGENDAQSISVYLRGVPWDSPHNTDVTVAEVDVVGSSWQASPQPLPYGARLIASRSVNGFLVDRFSVDPAWHLTPRAIAARAKALLGPVRSFPGILVQPASEQAR
jgi:hypothetical protein